MASRSCGRESVVTRGGRVRARTRRADGFLQPPHEHRLPGISSAQDVLQGLRGAPQNLDMFDPSEL